MRWGRRPLEGEGSEDRLRALAARFRESSWIHRGDALIRGRRARYHLMTLLYAVIGVAAGFAAYWLLTHDADTRAPRALAADGLSERRVYYRNCDAARLAGAAPLYFGAPGYRPPLDADGDGVACEPYYR